MAYSLDNIPEYLDHALRERAAAEHKSPEAMIVDLLASGLKAKSPQSKRAGSNSLDNRSVDPEFESALRDQNLIDWDAWCDGVKRRDLSGIAGQHLITPEMKAVFAAQRSVDPELWK